MPQFQHLAPDVGSDPLVLYLTTFDKALAVASLACEETQTERERELVYIFVDLLSGHPSSLPTTTILNPTHTKENTPP